MTDRTVPLLLTDYEAANLKALLAAMLPGVCTVESPLRAADTGDWTSVIWQKLPEVGCAPLASPDELARRARARAAQEFGITRNHVYALAPGGPRTLILDRERVVPIIEQALDGEPWTFATVSEMAEAVFDALDGSGEA